MNILEYKDLTHMSDLKVGNILMSFENESIVTDFIERQQPMRAKLMARVVGLSTAAITTSADLTEEISGIWLPK